jgi:hypothetical protein
MLTFDDMAGMNCCGFGSCGLSDRKILSHCHTCVYRIGVQCCEVDCVLLLGGGDRQAAWLGAPANVIRGSLGRQFPTGLTKGGTLPLFIPQYFRAIDVENMNGETVDVSVRPTLANCLCVGTLCVECCVAQPGHHRVPFSHPCQRV